MILIHDCIDSCAFPEEQLQQLDSFGLPINRMMEKLAFLNITAVV